MAYAVESGRQAVIWGSLPNTTVCKMWNTFCLGYCMIWYIAGTCYCTVLKAVFKWTEILKLESVFEGRNKRYEGMTADVRVRTWVFNCSLKLLKINASSKVIRNVCGGLKSGCDEPDAFACLPLFSRFGDRQVKVWLKAAVLTCGDNISKHFSTLSGEDCVERQTLSLSPVDKCSTAVGTIGSSHQCVMHP